MEEMWQHLLPGVSNVKYLIMFFCDNIILYQHGLHTHTRVVQ